MAHTSSFMDMTLVSKEMTVVCHQIGNFIYRRGNCAWVSIKTALTVCLFLLDYQFTVNWYFITKIPEYLLTTLKLVNFYFKE